MGMRAWGLRLTGVFKGSFGFRGLGFGGLGSWGLGLRKVCMTCSINYPVCLYSPNIAPLEIESPPKVDRHDARTPEQPSITKL